MRIYIMASPRNQLHGLSLEALHKTGHHTRTSRGPQEFSTDWCDVGLLVEPCALHHHMYANNLVEAGKPLFILTEGEPKINIPTAYVAHNIEDLKTLLDAHQVLINGRGHLAGVEWNSTDRPTWCPHADCIILRSSMDSVCGGRLPAPADHGLALGVNTHRVCIDTRETGHGIFDLQVNDNDLDVLRWIFEAIDGKITSWRSNRLVETGT